MSNLYNELRVGNFYKYKEVRKNKNVIEFGWDSCSPISSGPVVLSLSEDFPDRNGATSLEDYRKYFSKLTGLEPQDFLAKWNESLNDFQEFWIANKPSSNKAMALFVYNLALLLTSGKSFQHQFEDRMINFKIVDVKDERSRSSSGNTDSALS